MAKFLDLTEQDRIQYVKDGFVLILERLAKDPSKLKEYIPLSDKPKAVCAALEIPSDTIIQGMSEEDKKALEERSKLAEANAKAINDKAEEEFKKKEETYKKAESIITSLQKKEGCLCGACININITNSVIQPELEPLIDAAKKEAEGKLY